MTQAVSLVVSPSAQTGRSRSIGLCLIVKNEAQVITRCLDSVKPLVDFMLVEDTGSTDGTQQIIADWLRQEAMPGLVVEEAWQNFAYNRSHALERLRATGGVDYALIMDADDRLVLHDGFDPAAYKASLDCDLYDIQIRHGDSRFYRPQLCANRQPFCFKGVLHEYLEAPPGHISRANAEGFHVQTGSGGVRSRNPRKYEDDAAALARALQTETDPFLISRYTFYLAQSYRDCNEREKALACYLKRAGLGYWAEEVFESLYAAAKLQEELGFVTDEVIATYQRATATVPTRAEALHGASQLCRSKGRNEEGFRFAQLGLELALPTGGLFVKAWIYQYGLLDELAINGYWSGHYRESLEACLRLLEGTALPADQRQRVAGNARFALEKLPKAPELGSAGQSDLAAQHALTPVRPLRSQVIGEPKVLLAILAKQKAEMLPLFLDCIEALDYPKSSIVLHVRTNNNTDGTEHILRDWIARMGHRYAAVEFDDSDVPEPVERFTPHEWNAMRFRVLGRIRDTSLQRTIGQDCAFYFVVDVDNFIRPCTLRELVALNLPVTAPLLRSLEPGRFYSNYHAEVDADGYYRSSDQYMWLLNRWIRGVIEVPVVHTTYLVRGDVIPDLGYGDATERHEYVVFSDRARRAGVVQYLDNRQVYGYIAFGESSEQHVPGGIERARKLLAGELPFNRACTADTTIVPAPVIIRGKDAVPPRLFACFGLHSSGSTWMLNLVREICTAAGIPIVSIHRDWKRNLPWDTAGQSLIVAKSHSPDAEFRAYAAESSDPVVITVRDPRDAMVSLMQRFPNGGGADFDKALKAVAWSAECMVSVARARDVPVFRYEDGFVGTPETFDRVAALLGVTLSQDRRDSILAGLAPDAVRNTIARLEAVGTIRGDAVWDSETHWHANHVGDGRVGKWREVLSDTQAQEIADRTAEYCRLFGYDADSAPMGLARPVEHTEQANGTDHRSIERQPMAVAQDRLVATFKSCPVCGTTGSTKPRPELEPHPYVRCDGCGLFYQPYMQAKVFEAHHEARGDLMSQADRNANRSLALSLYRNHLIPRFGSQTLAHLDIGSKYPYFGHCLQNIATENGGHLVSHGMDGIAEARDFGRQLGVLMAVGDFEGDPLSWDMPASMRERIGNGGFHCVSLLHCMEHFYNPLQTLRNIRRLMADGGILFIRSPDSQAPGVERDFTSGHYDIHPTIWCESAMHEALARVGDAFTIYETYELGPQRDYLLRAVDRRITVVGGSVGATETSNVAADKHAPCVINILRPGAIGDVLMTGAVTAQFAARDPETEVHYYTGVPQMAELLVGVDKVLDADNWGQRETGVDFNLIGYPLSEGYPEQPMQKHLTAYFCDEAGLPPGLPQLRDLEPFEIKQRSWITIHPKAGWSVYKEWSMENWNRIVTRFRHTYPGIAIVQIGGGDDPALQEMDYDLRGKTSISQALWLLKNSVLHLGVDSFTNHAAGAFKHPAVIVFGSTSPTGSGYGTAVNLWAGLTCSPCYREDPRLSCQSRGPCINPPGQLYEQPQHACMQTITTEMVWQAIVDLMPSDAKGEVYPASCRIYNADAIASQQ